MFLRAIIFSLSLLMTSTVIAHADTVLVMVEEEGCYWCYKWDEEIAEIYPKTSEGKAAPLVKLDIHDEPPPDFEFVKALTFTPTFVLLKDGKEVSRIEGYPGEDFFWGLLAQMLALATSEGTG